MVRFLIFLCCLYAVSSSAYASSSDDVNFDGDSVVVLLPPPAATNVHLDRDSKESQKTRPKFIKTIYQAYLDYVNKQENADKPSFRESPTISDEETVAFLRKMLEDELKLKSSLGKIAGPQTEARNKDPNQGLLNVNTGMPKSPEKLLRDNHRILSAVFSDDEMDFLFKLAGHQEELEKDEKPTYSPGEIENIFKSLIAEDDSIEVLNSEVAKPVQSDKQPTSSAQELISLSQSEQEKYYYDIMEYYAKQQQLQQQLQQQQYYQQQYLLNYYHQAQQQKYLQELAHRYQYDQAKKYYQQSQFQNPLIIPIRQGIYNPTYYSIRPNYYRNNLHNRYPFSIGK